MVSKTDKPQTVSALRGSLGIVSRFFSKLMSIIAPIRIPFWVLRSLLTQRFMGLRELGL